MWAWEVIKIKLCSGNFLKRHGDKIIKSSLSRPVRGCQWWCCTEQVTNFRLTSGQGTYKTIDDISLIAKSLDRGWVIDTPYGLPKKVGNAEDGQLRELVFICYRYSVCHNNFFKHPTWKTLNSWWWEDCMRGASNDLPGRAEDLTRGEGNQRHSTAQWAATSDAPDAHPPASAPWLHWWWSQQCQSYHQLERPPFPVHLWDKDSRTKFFYGREKHWEVYTMSGAVQHTNRTGVTPPPIRFMTSETLCALRRLSTIARGASLSFLANALARATPPTSGDTTTRSPVGILLLAK